MGAPVLAGPPNRLKTFLLGGAFSVIARVVAVVLGLVSVPVGLHYFGAAGYGLWLVVSSTLAYLSMSQLGIGSAVGVFVAQSTSSAKQRTILWRAAGMLSVVASGSLLLFGLVVTLFPGWVGVFGSPPAELLALGAQAFIASAIFYFLGIPLATFASAFAGLQLIHLARLYDMLNQFAVFGALVTIVALRGNLVTLAIATGGASIAVSLIAALHLFLVRPDLWFHRDRDPDVPPPRAILLTGLRFFIVGIASMVVWSTDNLVVNYFLGPAAVTAYATTFRLFANGFALFMIVNGVVGPMYSNAVGRGDWDWIARTYRAVCALLPTAGGLLWLGGIIFAGDIIRLWVGPEAFGGLRLVMALGLYGYCLSLVNSHATLLSSIVLTNRLVWVAWSEAAANLIFSLVLVRYFQGAGVALGTALASLLTVFWLAPLQVPLITEGRVRFRFAPVALHATVVLAPAIGLLLLIGQGWTWWTGLAKIAVMGAYCAASWALMPRDIRQSLGEVFLARWRRGRRLPA